jgi:predicted alpha/beta superfamily hydrolase
VQLLTREAECAAKSSLLHLLGHEKLFYTGGDSKQHAKFIEKTLQPLVRRPWALSCRHVVGMECRQHEKLFYTGGDSKQHAKFIEKTLQPLVRRP